MNISQKYTPGPWHVEMNDNYMRLYMPASGLEGDVARGYVGEATARLIAAAPEMLAALEEAKQFIQNGIEYGYINMPEKRDHDSATETPGKIEAAIRKAKGESC